MFDISKYEEKLKSHDYRVLTSQKVRNWDRELCEMFLDNLSEDQIDDKLPKFRDMSVHEQRKLVCLVVWGWGWEGSEYFRKMYTS